ncbi:hypothetical protein AAY473_004616 [Plecturocebus cupreus]
MVSSHKAHCREERKELRGPRRTQRVGKGLLFSLASHSPGPVVPSETTSSSLEYVRIGSAGTGGATASQRNRVESLHRAPSFHWSRTSDSGLLSFPWVRDSVFILGAESNSNSDDTRPQRNTKPVQCAKCHRSLVLTSEEQEGGALWEMSWPQGGAWCKELLGLSSSVGIRPGLTERRGTERQPVGRGGWRFLAPDTTDSGTLMAAGTVQER